MAYLSSSVWASAAAWKVGRRRGIARIPTDNLFRRGEGGIELLSMNGLVAEGEPHIHITLSMPDGAFGGHLEPGCIAYVMCEVFLAEVEGATMSRQRVPVSVEGMGEGNILRLMFENT